MKNDIPYYIRRHIEEYQLVHLNGIGSLRIKHYSASFNTSKSILNPPSADLEFFNKPSFASPMLPAISSIEGISIEEARVFLQSYVNQLKDKLTTQKTVTIRGIGSFILGDENDIHFLSAYSENTDELRNLPSINVGDNTLYNRKVVFKNESIQNHNVKTPIYSLIIGGIILALVYVIIEKTLQRLCPSSEDNHEQQLMESNHPLPNISSVASSNVKQGSFRTSPKAHCNDDNARFGKLVLGSFSNKINAKNMFDRVQRAGYQAFQEKHNGMIRVGIRFFCHSEELSNFRKNIENRFGAKSWILLAPS